MIRYLRPFWTQDLLQEDGDGFSRINAAISLWLLTAPLGGLEISSLFI